MHTQKAKSFEAEKTALLKELDRIRSGTWFDGIIYLFNYKFRSGRVNSQSVYQDFGVELGVAFSEGLAKIWRQIEIPNPADYLDNRLPWTGLIGLESVGCAFNNGLNIEDLTPDDVSRAAQLCIWEHGKPEPWFEHLVRVHVADVSTALMPWLEFELALADENSERRTIDLALQSPIVFKRIFLEKALKLLSEERIPCKRIVAAPDFLQ